MERDDHEAADRVGHVCALLERTESLPDPAARTTAIELLQSLLELYGEALARVMAAGDDALRKELADDELVSHLLLLHGLHPVDPRTRAEAALGRLRPILGRATAELVDLAENVARVRLRQDRGGCGGATARLRTAVQEAIRDAAPEIERVEIDEAGPAPVLIPVESLRRGTGAA
ncbi:NifU family protein [Streptosporangium soli]|nr:NifU family protein [Streptosporangium sp. KLBMP 9127]